jgi:hypothetical protein
MSTPTTYGRARLVSLPGGNAATGRPHPATYTLTELDESQDAALQCCECVGVIERGAPMTYYVDIKEGFDFFHPECASGREELARA